MTRTIQRLASRSFTPVTINPNTVLNVPTGLQFPDGTPANPRFVDFPGPCPFVKLLRTNDDGSFDAWNPSENQVVFDWVAHHCHSEEQEPILPIVTVPGPSTLDPPTLCTLPGYASQEDLDQEIQDRIDGDQNLQDQIDAEEQAREDADQDLQDQIDALAGDIASSYLLGEYWLNVLEITETARNKTANIIHTDTDPDSLATAIAGAVNNDVIEVQTSSTYNPVTIPAGVEFQVRAGSGFAPKISGAGAVRLNNGASKVIIAGFEFPNCSTYGNLNETGAAVTFPNNHCLVNNIIFDKCKFQEVQNGSSVMLSYFWSTGGEFYYSPPQPNLLSKNISFIECSFDHACKDGNEGSALALRGVDYPFVYKSTFNGQNEDSRGVQLQNCTNCMVHSCEAYNISGANGEGVKLDTIGSPVAVYPSGRFIRNKIHNTTEGLDLDDYAFAQAIDNLCYDNSTEGISVDNDACVSLENNICWGNATGILLENGAKTELQNNHCYSNTANYSILNGYSLPSTNIDGIVVPTPTTDKKRQGMVSAEMIAADQTEEAAQTLWFAGPPSSVESALSKVANNQFFPFEGPLAASQGSILYRGVSKWARLAPGAAGQFLQTQGAGANPQWAAAGGGAAKDLAPSIVVGSLQAGDTLADCDYLHDNLTLPAGDAITAAVNLALTMGRAKIYVRRGTYNTNLNDITGVPPFSFLTNVMIEGEGIGETRINFLNAGTCVNGLIAWGGGSDCGIKNLTIEIQPFLTQRQNAFVFNTCYSPIIENVALVVSGTTVFQFGSYFAFYDCQYPTFRKNLTNSQTADWLIGKFVYFGNCNYGTIEDNVILVYNYEAIHCLDCNNLKIINNVTNLAYTTSIARAIFVEVSAGDITKIDILIQGNSCIGYIQAYCGSSGTGHIKDLRIENNRIESGQIQVSANDNSVNRFVNLSVCKNHIYHSAAVSNANDCLIFISGYPIYSKINENHLYTSSKLATASNRGMITLAKLVFFEVCKNLIHSTINNANNDSHQHIYVDSDCLDGTIEGNVLKSSFTGTGSNTFSGIRLATGTQSRFNINNNTITNDTPTAYGIRIVSNGKNFTICGNVFYFTATPGTIEAILLVGNGGVYPTAVSISGNTFNFVTTNGVCLNATNAASTGVFVGNSALPTGLSALAINAAGFILATTVYNKN